MALRANGQAIMNETSLIAFVAVTSTAVVLQTLILAGMYFSTRKMSKRMEALSTRFEEQVLPLVEKVRAMVDESAPMIRTVVTNVTETSGLVRTQAGRIDEVVTEIVDKTRVQVNRADELATRTMLRVDVAAGTLQNSVAKPVRHFSALMDGVMVGFNKFVASNKARNPKSAVTDETTI